MSVKPINESETRVGQTETSDPGPNDEQEIAGPASTPGLEAKWAAVVGDRPMPLPRRRVRAAIILAQSGQQGGLLVRDLNQPLDIPIAVDTEVDLAEGNVFRIVGKCDLPQGASPVSGAAKLAFFMDDAWEVTVQPNQSLDSLRALFDLPDDAEILRDYPSPRDERIRVDAVVRFRDGPVFVSRITSIIIKVNNKPVRFSHRRVTGLEIKQAAMAQGVSIDLQFVLYQMTPTGDLGPVVQNHQHVLLRKCDQFRCIAPDDNSQDIP